jgi:hypothetical protein
VHSDELNEPVLGRLAARDLHDELEGSAFAIVEGVDGGFQLVPSRLALEEKLGQQIAGTMTGRGVDWNFRRNRDPGI